MTDYPKLSMIVAHAQNQVIGRDGDLPWRIPSDLKFFKRTTLGKPVLMGRVTWESLPFPLPGRPNLVLSRNSAYTAKGAEVFTSLEEMVGRGFELAGELGADEVMIIGGARLYEIMMPHCRRIYVTEVQAEVEGDAYFPKLNAQAWKITAEEKLAKQPGDDYSVIVKIYDRKSA